MKPAGMGSVVFPRGSRFESIPNRCTGSGIEVRVETDEEAKATSRAWLIEDTLKLQTCEYSADQLTAMSDRELEYTHYLTWQLELAPQR
jgi:hypothetical protein